MEGQEFASIAAARDSAMDAAAAMLAEEMIARRSRVVLEFRIDDAAGVRCATLPVTAVVTGLT